MTETLPPVYFYPHAYLRDRHLDTIRTWPAGQALNPELAERRGDQVSRQKALAPKHKLSWKQRLPLLNLKRRPEGAPAGSAIYVWGGIIVSGPFILDLDNPYALTGYNYRAMTLYRGILQRLLESPRCLQIRCMSEACREGVRLLFGPKIHERAIVVYPRISRLAGTLPEPSGGCRFLFVGTQFDIKGGAALIRAFRTVREAAPNATLDLISHLPNEYADEAAACPGLTVHSADLSRNEVYERFMSHCDVLVHPSYMESFGMVVLEALAHGLAIIATDVYAMKEMVQDGANGILLPPPISAWEGILPSRYQYDWPNFRAYVRATDTRVFEERLAAAMIRMAQDPVFRKRARRGSLELLAVRFCPQEAASAYG